MLYLPFIETDFLEVCEFLVIVREDYHDYESDFESDFYVVDRMWERHAHCEELNIFAVHPVTQTVYQFDYDMDYSFSRRDGETSWAEWTYNPGRERPGGSWMSWEDCTDYYPDYD